MAGGRPCFPVLGVWAAHPQGNCGGFLGSLPIVSLYLLPWPASDPWGDQGTWPAPSSVSVWFARAPCTEMLTQYTLFFSITLEAKSLTLGHPQHCLFWGLSPELMGDCFPPGPSHHAPCGPLVSRFPLLTGLTPGNYLSKGPVFKCSRAQGTEGKDSSTGICGETLWQCFPLLWHLVSPYSLPGQCSDAPGPEATRLLC